MRMLGIVLIVLGVLAMTYKGIPYNKEHDVIDVGPIHARVEEKKTFPISPVLGGVAIIAGLVLITGAGRRVT